MGLMILIMIAFFGNLCMNGVDDIDNDCTLWNLCMNGVHVNDNNCTLWEPVDANDCILWEPVHEWG